MAAPAVEDETDLRDPDLLKEQVSSDGESEGSESEDSETEPERTAADHGYNLRPKRTEAGAATAPARNKKNTIAPGEGVEADRRHVGGRDKRVSCKPYGVSARSESSDGELSETGTGSGESSRPHEGQTLSEPYDDTPRSWYEGQGLTLGRRRLASSLLSSMSREELEAQSARLIAYLRESTQGRERRLSPPTNELVIRRDSSRPSDAGRSEKNRREPSASNLLGRAPEKPGRGLFSDIIFLATRNKGPELLIY